MRTLVPFAMVLFMSTAVASQTLPVPQAVTDPKAITAKSNLEVEQFQQNLAIDRLYMTRQIGGSTWSPDGKTIAFITNISGRNNLWTVPSDGGWPTQLTISDQRQTQPAWSPGRILQEGKSERAFKAAYSDYYHDLHYHHDWD